MQKTLAVLEDAEDLVEMSCVPQVEDLVTCPSLEALWSSAILVQTQHGFSSK